MSKTYLEIPFCDRLLANLEEEADILDVEINDLITIGTARLVKSLQNERR